MKAKYTMGGGNLISMEKGKNSDRASSFKSKGLYFKGSLAKENATGLES